MRAQCAVCIYGIYGACLKWMLPELSFSDRWSRGTKLWERDCECPLTLPPTPPRMRPVAELSFPYYFRLVLEAKANFSRVGLKNKTVIVKLQLA